MLLVVLILLAACAPHNHPTSPAPKPTTKFETVTFPADFVDPYMYSDDTHTPSQVARDLKSLGKQYCTDAYAKRDNSVILIVAQSQSRKIISNYSNNVKKWNGDFTKNSNEYHYKVNQDYTQLDAWVDNKLDLLGGTAITLLIPVSYGYLYYLEGGTGHWDMTINLYNCHDNQLKKTFTFRNQDSFTSTSELGD